MATTASAVTSTPAAETSAAPTTSATAFGLRPCFVHNQVPSTEVLTVQGIHRAVRFFVICDFDECESAGLSRKTVTDQIYCRGIDACLREIFVQGVFRGRKRKIAYIELLHLRTPSARNPDASRGARGSNDTRTYLARKRRTPSRGRCFSGQRYGHGNLPLLQRNILGSLCRFFDAWRALWTGTSSGAPRNRIVNRGSSARKWAMWMRRHLHSALCP